MFEKLKLYMLKYIIICQSWKQNTSEMKFLILLFYDVESTHSIITKLFGGEGFTEVCNYIPNEARHECYANKQQFVSYYNP